MENINQPSGKLDTALFKAVISAIKHSDHFGFLSAF
jgi:hypothetical protein